MAKTIYAATAITPGIYENIVKVMASSFAKHSTYKLHIYCLNFTNAQYENMKNHFGLDNLNIALHRVDYHCKYTTENKNKYTDLLDCTSCKFKIFSQSVPEDYFLWLDADTLVTADIDDIVKYLPSQDVAGNPKQHYVSMNNLEYNAGVILLRNKHENVLENYEQYLDNLYAANDKVYLGYADEQFIKVAYPHKAVLPIIYNSRYRNFTNRAHIQHFYGMYEPWVYPLKFMPSQARFMAKLWLTEYTSVKDVLSADFIEHIDSITKA